MAYYTGSAANLAEVLTALTSCCEAEGWTWDSGTGVLSIADPGIFVRLDAATSIQSKTPLRLWGRTAVDGGESDYYVMMSHISNIFFTYPVTYHCFVFASEVYFIVNYEDKYQWLAFGQSQQPGLVGTGNWIAGSVGHCYSTTVDYHTTWWYPQNGVGMTSSGAQAYSMYNKCSPALGWSNIGADNSYLSLFVNFWMDIGLEAEETHYPWSCTNDLSGIAYLTQLIDTQPQSFNNEGVLLPIKIISIRSSSKFSQAAQMDNARHIRVDNYTSQEIIALGTDQWMIFPWYRKDLSEPDGGTMVDHSGTFGWAIKYEP